MVHDRVDDGDGMFAKITLSPMDTDGQSVLSFTVRSKHKANHVMHSPSAMICRKWFRDQLVLRFAPAMSP